MADKDIEANKGKEERFRINGWSWPPSIQQVFAWGVIIVYTSINLTTLVPALHKTWQIPVYVVTAVVFLAHVVSHIAVCSIDPADLTVRRAKYPKKQFDRTRHTHVIENGFCNNCQVNVHSTSKHCRDCNKCVSDFDHHCDYLNTCVGGRNFRWFMTTFITALILFIIEVSLAFLEFVAYYTDQKYRQILQPYIDLSANVGHSDADFKIFYQHVIHKGFLALLGIYFILGIVMLAFLMDFFIFHMRLILKNISTYQYYLQKRIDENKVENKSSSSSFSSYISSLESLRSFSSNPSLKNMQSSSSVDLQNSDIWTLSVDYQTEIQLSSPKETPTATASLTYCQEIAQGYWQGVYSQQLSTICT